MRKTYEVAVINDCILSICEETLARMLSLQVIISKNRDAHGVSDSPSAFVLILWTPSWLALWHQARTTICYDFLPDGLQGLDH